MASGGALYNEIDPYAAAWLKNLISRGLIAPGDVAECSIEDLTPDILRKYTQVHFFAGIGVWSYSLRRAGWADTRPIWTGSCPCQPFSAAGKGGGFADERHLWPAFFHLIQECEPDIVLGEQVASKDGLAWIDLVQSDMEGAGYAFGPSDTCSAGFGAPHIRQRLRFAAYRLADATCGGSGTGFRDSQSSGLGWVESPNLGAVGELADANAAERRTDATGGNERDGANARRPQGAGDLEGCFQSSLLADSDGGNASTEGLQRSGQYGQRPQDGIPSGSEHPGIGHNGCPGLERPGPTNGFWSNPDWLYCRDGKWRPVESGTFPLAHGATSRVGRLRAYGNAVDAEATAEFCAAVKVYCDGATTLLTPPPY